MAMKLSTDPLVIAMGISLAQGKILTMQSNSENAESKLQNNGWRPFTTKGFTWWVTLEEIRDQDASIFVFLEPDHFSRDNLHHIFNHLSSRVSIPRLEITVLSDEEAIKEELRTQPMNRAIGIFDFFDNERGREGRRKYLERGVSEGKSCYRAFYTRSPDGKRGFKYTPAPDKESYIWINVEGDSLKEDSRMALIQAVELGDLVAIERLLSQGASLNIESPSGHTLLMFQPKWNKEA